jgi:hypothetical protein
VEVSGANEPPLWEQNASSRKMSIKMSKKNILKMEPLSKSRQCTI